MVSVFNINNGSKIPILLKIQIFGRYIKVRESLYTTNLCIIWVNIILNHIDIRAILPRYQGYCMVLPSSQNDSVFLTLARLRPLDH